MELKCFYYVVGINAFAFFFNGKMIAATFAMKSLSFFNNAAFRDIFTLASRAIPDFHMAVKRVGILN